MVLRGDTEQLLCKRNDTNSIWRIFDIWFLLFSL